MRGRIRHRVSSKLIVMSVSILVCLIATANVTQGTEIQGRILIRDDVSLNNQTELLKKLRAITGWTDLKFDNNGVLRWGKEFSKIGSKSARDLLIKAAEGDALIVLEDASARSDVAFCRVVPGRWAHRDLPDVRAFVMLIDFADFHEVTGDAEARAAFDVGWGFLHELHHVVNDSADARNMGEAGACENEINKMRSELGLPLRITYFFSPLPAKVNPEFTTRLVRLAFEKRDSRVNRTHRYWLIWDAATVGGLQQSETASLR